MSLNTPKDFFSKLKKKLLHMSVRQRIEIILARFLDQFFLHTLLIHFLFEFKEMHRNYLIKRENNFFIFRLYRDNFDFFSRQLQFRF